MASFGSGWTPPAPSALPTGPLPGETPEQYAYRQYQEARYAEQQAEQRAYADWQQAEARRYGEYQNADARAYGQYINADSRAYGEYQNADSRAYSEARQAQSDAERVGQNMATIASIQADNVANMLRNRVGLADRYASASRFARQPTGRNPTLAYKQTLGGY